jgi:glycine/D-amino acid oxidase-like deaminating enzyme
MEELFLPFASSTETPLSPYEWRIPQQRARPIQPLAYVRGLASAALRAWARRALVRLFPQLRGTTFEHEWYGMIEMTADALPRFH